MRKILVLTALAALICSAAQAEVLKTLNPCGTQRLCPSFALVLTPPDGWVVDAAATAERHVQILVPKGETYESAPAIIYVQVFYERDTTQTLADFARTSNARWLAHSATSKITPQGDLARANGKPSFLRFAYDNPGLAVQGHELGAFAPDSDKDGNRFVVDAVLTGDKGGVAKAEGTYVAWLKRL